ncbi:unnamed protein product [Cochlearia groenlandica]
MPTAEIFATAMTNWWDDVNESTQWQDGIFFALCGAYALVQLEYGWTTQKVFHLMNFVVNGFRAVLFGFHGKVFLVHPKARSVPTDKLRITYISVNVAVYLAQACPKSKHMEVRQWLYYPVFSHVSSLYGWICDNHMLHMLPHKMHCAFDRDLTLDVLDHRVLNLIYYMVVEVLPSALVLFILRKLPPKRVSYQIQ